ncbi:MAG: FkbM family methyltransferase [Candidatus Zambryskibacteria bacterium]|nr:FkbM family methyltransferase [Candidatus Zambryskibacteria bacterium]
MYFIHKVYANFRKWLYDLPKIGPHFRKRAYKNAFDSLQSGEVAIDCGANIGVVTKRMVKPGVRVYAFEPDPQAFEILKEKFRDNPDIISINKAVSDHAGQAKLYFHQNRADNPAEFSAGSSLLEDKGNIDKDNFIICEVVDLSDFISHLNDPIGILKIDVEGEEVKILNSLIDKGLVRRIRNILVETHERIPSLKASTGALRKRVFDNKIRNVDFNWA